MSNVQGLTIDSLVKMFCDKDGNEDFEGQYSTIKKYWSEMDKNFFISFVKKLLEIAAPTIVYVSCNPATQARDLEMLDAKYKVVKSQAVDMFPQTHHAENVVLLELR